MMFRSYLKVQIRILTFAPPPSPTAKLITKQTKNRLCCLPGLATTNLLVGSTLIPWTQCSKPLRDLSAPILSSVLISPIQVSYIEATLGLFIITTKYTFVHCLFCTLDHTWNVLWRPFHDNSSFIGSSLHLLSWSFTDTPIPLLAGEHHTLLMHSVALIFLVCSSKACHLPF